MPLTDPKAKNATAKEKDYKLSDERGLYLLVKKNGSKYWRMKYRFLGKEKTYSIGVYPEVTLKEARIARDTARKLLNENIDPSTDKKSQKQKLVSESAHSFEAIAREWYEKTKFKWSNTHTLRVKKGLENELFPAFGNKHIGEVTAPDLLAAIRKIEEREAFEVSKKVRRVAGQVFRYGIASGLCQQDFSSAIIDALQHKEAKHMASITDPKEVGKLLVAIDAYNGTPAVIAALKISPLLFQRPGEIRHMEWSEVNWDESRWEIPADKMKMRADHIVPLSKQSISILKKQQELTGSQRYAFPSARSNTRPLSENAVRIALRTMGYDKDTITPHGFRAMARTILDEVLNFRVDWIEHQLAHAVRDATGRAYNRTKFLPQRHEMMQKWADYLDELKLKSIQK
jgi:integrase